MTKYDFTIVLKDAPALTEELADRLFASGCDDATPGMASGVTLIDFHREAASLDAAIRSAIADIAAAECVAARVEIDAEALATTLRE